MRNAERLSSTDWKADSTVWRYWATVAAYAALYCLAAGMRAALKMGWAALAPIDQTPLDQFNRVAVFGASRPPDALRVILGKKAARATPISALAEATPRSAEAMSGRRSRSSDGRPLGIGGGFVDSGTVAME